MAKPPKLTPVTPNNQSDQSADDFSKVKAISDIIRQSQALNDKMERAEKQLKISILSNILLIVLLIILFSAFLAYPKVRYIATKDNEAICPVPTQDDPNLTDVTIAEFGKNAVLNLYTLDYINADAQINQTLDNYYTPEGRIAMVQALKDAGTVNTLKANAWTMRATATEAVKINERNIDEKGREYWLVQFPMVITVYSGGQNAVQTYNNMVNVRVLRTQSSKYNPRGILVQNVALEYVR